MLNVEYWIFFLIYFYDKLADEMPRTLVGKTKIWAGKPHISDEEREYIQHLHKAEELRHQEILFKIERYAISLFALFFLVFNAVYWTDLLYSAKFDER